MMKNAVWHAKQNQQQVCQQQQSLSVPSKSRFDKPAVLPAA
jgi:hypothetical protein